MGFAKKSMVSYGIDWFNTWLTDLLRPLLLFEKKNVGSRRACCLFNWFDIVLTCSNMALDELPQASQSVMLPKKIKHYFMWHYFSRIVLVHFGGLL